MLQKLDPKLMTNLKVLIVEDQAQIRSLMRDYFQMAGAIEIYEAANGQQAVEMMQSGDAKDANLILCDWNMPMMTGIDLLRHIREVNSEIPFLMMSGRADKESMIEAKGAGVSAYIPKPFTPLQLENKLDVVLNPYGAAATIPE